MLYVCFLLCFMADPSEKAQQCQEDITTSVDENQEMAEVSYMDSAGNMVNVSLPVGDFTFSYVINKETDCQFTISVMRKYFKLF